MTLNELSNASGLIKRVFYVYSIWGHPHNMYAQRGRTYYGQKNDFFDHKIAKLFFFCTKEAITLSFIIVYRKV